MLKRTLTAAALAAAALVSTTTPAHADFHSCALLGTATFSPRLTTTFVGNGSITLDYDYRCVAVDAGTAGTGILTGHNTYSVGYSGSCVTAALSGPGGSTGTLVGGTVGATLSISTSDGVREYTLVSESLNPCDMTRATLVSSITYGML